MEYLNSTQRSRSNSLIALLCVLLFGAVSAQTEIPSILDPVTDLTKTLDASEYSLLRAQIMQFQDSTSNQIVILMIPTLGDYEIRDFGIRILEKNKIGQKGKDNGILILVAVDDRKMSIETGYGLEGVLTDAVCDQIIRNDMKPLFKTGNYYQGLSAGISSIMSVTKGEYTGEKKNKKKNGGWFGFLMIVLVILIAIISNRRNRRYGISSRGNDSFWWGGGGGFGSFGGGSGGGGWSAGGGSFGGGGASGSW